MGLNMAIFALTSVTAALQPPVIEARWSRRPLAGALLAASSALFTRPPQALASAEAKRALLEKARAREAAEKSVATIDPLTTRLVQFRQDLGGCSERIAAKDWDEVRRLVNALLPLMTFRGYTGESVKQRAEAWAAAGDEQLAKEILVRRSALVQSLSRLDNGLFAAQTNNRKTMLSDEDLQSALDAVLVALDAVVDKMGCDRRWKSGACEILALPENKTLRDLVY